MKKRFRFSLLLFFLLTYVASAYSQSFLFSGQIKPRYEMRHGYGTLIPDDEQAANFISQRTRLNVAYSDQLFRVGISIQHIGVWGETVTNRLSDVNGASVHEAWGELLLGKKVSLKAGRQVLAYDDERMLGGVEWAQQARSHDAVLLTIRPKVSCRVDAGFAYNALRQSLFKEYYGRVNYRTMQFIHWQREFGDLGASILLLNTGFPWWDTADSSGTTVKEKIAYNQTLGFRLSYGKEKIKTHGAFYYQTGKVTVNSIEGNPESTRKLDAYYFALDFSYRLTPLFSAGAGMEYFSGNSMKEEQEQDNAFKPWFGTNHKFNGWMDYFYVGGQHMSSVGLMDVFVPLNFTNEKLSVSLVPHFFSATDDVWAPEHPDQDYEAFLGTEIDLTIGYSFSENVTISAGYSQMLATASMEVLKGGNRSNNNDWAWVMLDFKPVFFRSGE